MKKKQFIQILFIVLIGSTIGGSLTNYFLSGKDALAQKKDGNEIQDTVVAGTLMAERIFLYNFSRQKENVTIKPIVSIYPANNGDPLIEISDSDGNTRAFITVNDQKGGTMALLDAKRGYRAILTEKGPFPGGKLSTTFSLLDIDNNIRAQMGLRADGNPHIGIWDPITVSNSEAKFGRRIGLSLAGKDEVYFEIQDMEGNKRAVLGTETTKNIRTSATTKRSASSLVLYSEKGTVLWAAP